MGKEYFKINLPRDEFPQHLGSKKSVFTVGFKRIFLCHSDHLNHFETYPSKV